MSLTKTIITFLGLLFLAGAFYALQQRTFFRAELLKADTDHCIFCQIINNGKNDKLIILEKESLIVIKDINPKATTHLLIIPKKHLRNMKNVTLGVDTLFWNQLLETILELSKHLSNGQSFRLINNNEKEGMQTIFHLHWHFMSKDTLTKIN